MDFIYDYVDTDATSISLTKTNLRKNGSLSCTDTKNAEPVIQPKVTRQKSNLRRTSIYPSCVDSKKTEKYQARYRIKNLKYSKNFKFLVTNRSKRKRYDQRDENYEAKKRKTDGNGQESGGKFNQAETVHQKEKQQKRVNIDGSSEGSDQASTSCELLLEYFFKFGDLP